MSELKELKNKKNDIILNLDEDDIEKYIMSLSRKYYASLINGDALGLENVIESLKDIKKIYEFKYPDISDYINYCLVISSNKILRKVFDVDCILWTPNEKSITSFEGFNLAYSIERSRKKIINDECNVKELYEMVLSDETIDDAIVDKITDLYNSFKIFNLSKEM